MLRFEGNGKLANEFPQIIPLTGRSFVHQFIPKEVVCAIVLLVASALAVKSETVPLPRARPPVLEDQTSAPKIESERSPCQLQLSELAEFKSMPPITGPGECTATDVVNVNAVVLPDNQRVVFSPVVTLQCSMAVVVAHWIRDDRTPGRADKPNQMGCRGSNSRRRTLAEVGAVHNAVCWQQFPTIVPAAKHVSPENGY
jgi:hypothetical protein